MEFCNNNKTDYYSITIHIIVGHYLWLLFIVTIHSYYLVSIQLLFILLLVIIHSIIHIIVDYYCVYTVSHIVHTAIDTLFMLLLMHCSHYY